MKSRNRSSFLAAGSLRAALLAVAGAGIALSTQGAAAAPWPSETGALSRAVASAYESEERGVVAFDVAMTNTIRGGFYHRDDEDAAAFVTVDGRLVHKVVLRHVEGGKADDGAALTKRGAEPETPLSRFGMRLPCETSALAEYTFDAPQAKGATVTLPFHTRVRDQSHGDGAIVLDSAGGHIESIDFQPSVPPDKASAAHVVMTFGPLGGERYGITKIVRTFSGHVGPMRGSVVSNSVYQNVRVFPSAAAAIAAIDRERP